MQKKHLTFWRNCFELWNNVISRNLNVLNQLRQWNLKSGEFVIPSWGWLWPKKYLTWGDFDPKYYMVILNRDIMLKKELKTIRRKDFEI